MGGVRVHRGEPSIGRELRREPLGRGDFVRLAYRLGRSAATGMLSVHEPHGHIELLVLRRGHWIAPETEVAARLARLAAITGAEWSFDGGTAAYPPGATGRQVDLARWARQHLESQLDAARADHLIEELAGVRVSVRAEHAPDDAMCDDTDRRILAAMTLPRRLDQIASLARAPRFRLLAFVHFLRSVGALSLVGVAASAHVPGDDPRAAALRLLGLSSGADRDAVKRAYRRLARALHPDLQPGAGTERTRELEGRFAEVTAAYEELIG